MFQPVTGGDILQIVWLAVFFIIGNVLDAYTTYLCLFKLSRGLQEHGAAIGQGEMNPLAKDIGLHFWRTMRAKFIGVVLFVIYMLIVTLWLRHLTGFRVMDAVMVLVVLNNTYVFLGEKITQRSIMTPGKIVRDKITRRLHWPESFAFYMLASLYISTAYIIVWLLQGRRI